MRDARITTRETELRLMSIFRLSLLLTLWVVLLDRVLRWFDQEIPVLDVTLMVGSLPWSLLAIELFRPVDDPMLLVLRNLGFLLLMAVGIAVNAALFGGLLGWAIELLRGGGKSNGA